MDRDWWIQRFCPSCAYFVDIFIHLNWLAEINSRTSGINASSIRWSPWISMRECSPWSDTSNCIWRSLNLKEKTGSQSEQEDILCQQHHCGKSSRSLEIRMIGSQFCYWYVNINLQSVADNANFTMSCLDPPWDYLPINTSKLQKCITDIPKRIYIEQHTFQFHATRCDSHNTLQRSAGTCTSHRRIPCRKRTNYSLILTQDSFR